MTRQAEARTHLGVLEMAEEGAHRKYATDEERCDRLIREYKKWGLERRNLAMMDLPAAQVRRFNAVRELFVELEDKAPTSVAISIARKLATRAAAAHT